MFISRLSNLIFSVFILAFLIYCSDSTSSSSDIDPALVGDWEEYTDITFMYSYYDGVRIQSDGKMFDLEEDEGGWVVDLEDLEGTFTSAKNGTFKLHWTEEGDDENLEGTYTIIEDYLTVNVTTEGLEDVLYYMRLE